MSEENLAYSRRLAVRSLIAGGAVSSLLLTNRTAAAATVTTSPQLFNVLDFGATGNGSTDDTASIQSAVNSAAVSGGTVYLPATKSGLFYKTTNAIVVQASNVVIKGDGALSCIGAFHGADTIQFIGTASVGLYNNGISGLRFASYNKGGGYDVYATQVNLFSVCNVQMNGGFNGFYVNNFNTITLENIRVVGYRGPYRGYLCGGASGVGRSDVAYLYNVTLGGETPDSASGCYGLIIDGFVNTVTAVNLYVLSLGAAGLLVQNAVGASQIATFLSFYGLQSEFCAQQSVLLTVGWRIMFSDIQLHGSKTADNIYVANSVKTVSFSGGFSTGAALSGIASEGQDVMISNVMTQWNSFAGITLGSNANGVVITGCRSGVTNEGVSQPWGCWVNTGADNFAITGNCFTGNSKGGVINGAGTGPSRVIVNNV